MSFKHILLLCSIALLITVGHGQTKLMSFNIRYNNPNDKENWWENRKQEVVSLIDFYNTDFIGIQEGLADQVLFIDNKLDRYSYIGVGRDDGKQKGEFAAIFYNSEKFELLDSKSYWLSDTPNKVSVGWDASMERIVTYGAFQNKNSLDSIFVFNCHFDHIGKLAQKNSAELILKIVQELGLDNRKVVVMGDLNCEPDEEPILILTSVLSDTFVHSKTTPYGPAGTFNAFDRCSAINSRIDYILTKNLNVKSYRNIDDKRKNGLCISDHLPVLVEVF